MEQLNIARGNKKRLENKGLRKVDILKHARNLIASKGFDAFTLSELATVAGVSIPTIHNLFGKKHDIFKVLVEEMVIRIEKVILQPDMTNPIEAAIAFIDNLLELFKKDEAFYRAAFVAGERSNLFEHKQPTGIFSQSLKIAEQLCISAKEKGFLNGLVDSKWLAKQLFGCQRLARQDWVNGYIDLQQYKNQVLIGMFITFSADATDEYKVELLNKIDSLT